MKAYNRERASLKECYDNLIFLKDMRNEIPHDFKMSPNLKKADKLLIEEIKYWENEISSRDRSKKTS